MIQRIGKGLQSFRRAESGNIFFALFGAVALIGVVGAASMQVMKGPVRAMSQITKRTIAENNIIASAKLTLIDASQQASSGDCDSDGYVEPKPYVSGGSCTISLTGGGCLPSSLGVAQNDPWNTQYGYCVWDHGAVTAGCTESLASGGNLLAGTNANTEYVIAILSAGPDRTFQTTCAASPTGLTRASGSDDVVLGYTYGEAQAAVDGLWNLQTGDPATAEISKSLEVKDSGGTTTFSLDNATGIGDFLGVITAALTAKGSNPIDVTGGFKFDDATGVPTCNAANDNAMRFNTSSNTLQFCDNGTGWTNVGSSSDIVHDADNDTKIQAEESADEDILRFDTFGTERMTIAKTGEVAIVGAATVGTTLGVTGATTLSTLSTSGAATLNSLGVTGAATVGTTLGVTGATTLSTLSTSGLATLDSASVTNNATVGGTLGVTGATTLSTLSTSGLATLDSASVTNNATVGGTLGVTGATTLSSTASIGGQLDMTTNKIVNLGTPTANADATTKLYVDTNIAAGTGYTETDPQVDNVTTAGKYCRTDGTAIQCDKSAVTILSEGGAVTSIDALSDAVSTGNTTPYNLILGHNTAPGANDAYNTAVGLNALDSLSNSATGSEGYYNTAMGYNALTANTTGFQNTANGVSALSSNTTGINNMANGYGALSANTTGSSNTANGVRALLSNTTGAYNTANGLSALYANTIGSYNTANGVWALYANTTGSNNTANGVNAGRYITGGATANATSGTSVYLGANTKASADGNANEIVIGYDTTGNGSNTVTLGNDSITATYLKGNTLLEADSYLNFGTTSGTTGYGIRDNSGTIECKDSGGAWAACAGGGGSETDPQVDDVSTSGNVCKSTGTAVTCTLVMPTCTGSDKALQWDGSAFTCVTIKMPCTLPWGGTLASGSSVTAYLEALPTGPCTSESRLCTNGVLSGSYTNETCTAGCASTSLSWGGGCSATAPATASGSAAPLTDPYAGSCAVGDWSGSASATCTSGSWGPASGSCTYSGGGGCGGGGGGGDLDETFSDMGWLDDNRAVILDLIKDGHAEGTLH